MSPLEKVELIGGGGDDVLALSCAQALIGIGGSEVFVYGGDGNDSLGSTATFGVTGGEIFMDAGAGNDHITVTAPFHTLEGGDGNDTFWMSGLDNPMVGGWNDISDAIDNGANNDRLFVNGTQVTPALIGGSTFGGSLWYDFQAGKHFLDQVQLNV